MNPQRSPGASLIWRPAVIPVAELAVLARVLDSLRALDPRSTTTTRKVDDMALSWAGPEDPDYEDERAAYAERGVNIEEIDPSDPQYDD